MYTSAKKVSIVEHLCISLSGDIEGAAISLLKLPELDVSKNNN